MPAFTVRKEPFNWITTGRKSVELRKGKARKGNYATFLSGRRQAVKARIVKKQEGTLTELLNPSTFHNIVPTARNLDEAIEYIKRFYPSLEGTFTAYEIGTRSKKQINSPNVSHTRKEETENGKQHPSKRHHVKRR